MNVAEPYSLLTGKWKEWRPDRHELARLRASMKMSLFYIDDLMD